MSLIQKEIIQINWTVWLGDLEFDLIARWLSQMTKDEVLSQFTPVPKSNNQANHVDRHPVICLTALKITHTRSSLQNCKIESMTELKSVNSQSSSNRLLIKPNKSPAINDQYLWVWSEYAACLVLTEDFSP